MRYDIWNLGSSSEGNCFIVKHKNSSIPLMLDCGMSFYQIMRRSKQFNAPFPEAIFISHEHRDHSCGWEKLIYHVTHIYASEGTAEMLHENTFHVNMRHIHTLRPFTDFTEEIVNCDPEGAPSDEWTVFPLPAKHDSAEPFMYLIRQGRKNSFLLFAIDTAEIPYDLTNFNITDVLIECNYMDECIAPDIDPFRIARTKATHMSLDTLVKFFESGQINLKNLEQITLCHLSQSNCDPWKAKETIMAATGVPVQVCAAKGGFIG